MKFRKTSDLTVSQPNVPARGDLLALHRRRRTRRYIVIGVVLIAAIAIHFAYTSWVTGDGVVVGDLGAVMPINTARITNLHAKCLDFVSRGQVLVDVENEAVAQSAQQEMQVLQATLAQSNAEGEIADKEIAAAQNYYAAQIALRDQLASVLKAQTDLLRGKYVAPLVWEKAKADVVEADANAQAAEYVVETKQADRNRATLESQLAQKRIDSFAHAPSLLGAYQLTAPTSGFLTQCNAVVGTVVDNTATLYQIFNPNDAYVIAFLDPSDAMRLHPGTQLTVTIAGLRGGVNATVSGFYPEYSGLPDALTRYFWQQEKWSQYEPVRLDFNGLDDEEVHKLRDSAQVSVSLWLPPETGIYGQFGRWLAPLIKSQSS